MIDFLALIINSLGKSVCSSEFASLLTVFQINVARVDFESETKDYPYAHFDAEKFLESNDLVKNFITNINNALALKDYSVARALSGQVLHTIQDL